MANNKQLRLDVAQLTDVGRKREHNEDNMAYVIPKDALVMTKKGALFIVADGMGGHAAGEVASEIAVDTVSNEYYKDESDDVSISLLHAIKRANALIKQRADENMLRTGMGTTCVAAVLRGSMAYIANVGDSRAYLVRAGKVKQVSQDHSWVAEQVRAGLLTEDQARTHAQRNVITRSLGTQTEVEIDVFHEQMEEKDFLVLCSDGLSGLVSDDEIRKIVDQASPQESVYHLVERANANGGPDNITAIVVSVPEVGSEPPGVRRPVFVGGGRESGEDTALLGLPPTATGPLAPGLYADKRVSTGSLLYPSGPLPLSEIPTAPTPTTATVRAKGGRLLYTSLALLLLLLVALAAGVGYYYVHVTGASANATIDSVEHAIAQANSKLQASDPSGALGELALAQNLLRGLQTNSLSDNQKTTVAVLQKRVASQTQSAISSYNNQSFITALPCTNATPKPQRLNVGTTATQTKASAVVQVPGSRPPSSMMYTLGVENTLYQVQNNSLIRFRFPAPYGGAKVLDIAGNGTQLVALLSLGGGNGPVAYSLALLTPGQHTKVDATVPLAAAQIKSGLVPTLISASTPDIYVLLAPLSSTQGSSYTLLHYTPPAPGAHAKALLSPDGEGNLSISQPVVSMVAFPNHQLFFLLAGGSVQSLVLQASGSQAATDVLLKTPIAQPLPAGQPNYSWTTPVPEPTAATGKINHLAIPGTSLTRALAVGFVRNVPHLYVLDAALHRMLDLQATGGIDATPTPTSQAIGGGGVTGSVVLELVRQYTSPSLFNQVRSMAFNAQNQQANVLTQDASVLQLITFSATGGCA